MNTVLKSYIRVNVIELQSWNIFGHIMVMVKIGLFGVGVDDL